MPRLYAGQSLRTLRLAAGLNQRAMAARLGLSISYLSQLETGERPLTPAVATALARHYPQALAAIEGEAPARRRAALGDALADPSLAPLDPADVTRLADERPEIADRLIALHAGKRAAEDRLALAEESLTAGSGARLPWEAVRDWFHEAGNYIDTLDRAAETLSVTWSEALATHDITLATDPDEDAPLSRFDGRTLTLNATLPPESRRFLIAHRLAATAFADEIAGIVAAADLPGPEAHRLLGVGLANYAAGALVMPYAAFRAAARELRHDIDRLSRRFGVSFEQACHRLSTLQRPGAQGLPFYFCRVDMAGNITKRHSATRLQFARFGGACPLWHVHEAVAIPDRILVQHAETPDGVRYVSMAKGLVKPSGRFDRLARRYAVVLGCEATHAADFVYADAIDRTGAPTPDRHPLPPLPPHRLRPARLPPKRPRDRGGTGRAARGAVSGGVTMSVYALLADVEHMQDAAGMKPWNMTVGIAIGLVVGVLLWWGSYVPSEGMFQNPQLVIVPSTIAILIVSVRNRRKKVGPYDPKVIARNKRGRV